MFIDGEKLRLALQQRLEEGDFTIRHEEFRQTMQRAWEDVVQPVIDAANEGRQATLPSTGSTVPCGSDIAHHGSSDLPRHLGGRRSQFGR